MEIPSLQGLSIDPGLLTMEKPVAAGERHTSLRIGVPAEISNEERRVALAPSGVAALVANEHEVYVEKSAGTQAHFSDSEYSEAGATIVDSASQLYSKSNLIVKVGRRVGWELDLLAEAQILLSALRLGRRTPECLKQLMELRVTAIAFEFIRERGGTLPIVRLVHQIMGSLSVPKPARCLECGEGGKG